MKKAPYLGPFLVSNLKKGLNIQYLLLNQGELFAPQNNVYTGL